MARLTAFYSRAGENYFAGGYRTIPIGNTARAARIIADASGSDLLEIRQKTPYSDIYKECTAQAVRDLKANARPELTGMPEDLDKYDEIFLCYPNYCGTMPMAVYTFLESYDLSGKVIHPFCTHEGSGLGHTPEHIASLAPAASITSGFDVKGSQVDERASDIADWAMRDRQQ